MYKKYPKTYHFPWSCTIDETDKILPSLDSFYAMKEVICSEKGDGECTTFYHDHIHARSMDSWKFTGSAKLRESRKWVQALHGRIKHEIPENMRICGENMYAKHSIFYNNLPSYFLVFGIYEQQEHILPSGEKGIIDVCISWNDAVDICEMLGLTTVPILYRGVFDNNVIHSYYTRVSKFSKKSDDKDCNEEYNVDDTQEGYVVRNSQSFFYDDFQENVGKFVREKHVRTTQHWLDEPLIVNQLTIK